VIEIEHLKNELALSAVYRQLYHTEVVRSRALEDGMQMQISQHKRTENRFKSSTQQQHARERDLVGQLEKAFLTNEQQKMALDLLSQQDATQTAHNDPLSQQTYPSTVQRGLELAMQPTSPLLTTNPAQSGAMQQLVLPSYSTTESADMGQYSAVAVRDMSGSEVQSASDDHRKRGAEGKGGGIPKKSRRSK
jgi:hypothetical protein